MGRHRLTYAEALEAAYPGPIWWDFLAAILQVMKEGR